MGVGALRNRLNSKYLGLEAKMEKSKTILFSRTFEGAEPAPGFLIHYDNWTLNFAFWKLGLNPIYNTYLYLFKYILHKGRWGLLLK